MFAYHCISLIQDVQFCQETHIRLFLEDHAMNLLRLFNINSMCLATDTPKRGGIQKKKKTHLMGIVVRILDAAVHGCHCPGDMAVRMRKVLPSGQTVGWCSSVSLAFIVVTVLYVRFFYFTFRITALLGTTTKKLKKSNVKCYF